MTSKLSESGLGIIVSTLDEFECSFENASFSMVFKLFGLKLAFVCKNRPNLKIVKFQIKIFFALGVLRMRPTHHSKAHNANFLVQKY